MDKSQITCHRCRLKVFNANELEVCQEQETGVADTTTTTTTNK